VFLSGSATTCNADLRGFFGFGNEEDQEAANLGEVEGEEKEAHRVLVPPGFDATADADADTDEVPSESPSLSYSPTTNCTGDFCSEASEEPTSNATESEAPSESPTDQLCKPVGFPQTNSSTPKFTFEEYLVVEYDPACFAGTSANSIMEKSTQTEIDSQLTFAYTTSFPACTQPGASRDMYDAEILSYQAETNTFLARAALYTNAAGTRYPFCSASTTACFAADPVAVLSGSDDDSVSDSTSSNETTSRFRRSLQTDAVVLPAADLKDCNCPPPTKTDFIAAYNKGISTAFVESSLDTCIVNVRQSCPCSVDVCASLNITDGSNYGGSRFLQTTVNMDTINNPETVVYNEKCHCAEKQTPLTRSPTGSPSDSPTVSPTKNPPQTQVT